MAHDPDPIIHQPTRLRIMVLLSGVEQADFVFLLNALSLTNGNLSVHMRRLEDAGYVEVAKEFRGRMPNTSYRLTDLGRHRLDDYWRTMDAIRR